MPSEIVGTGSRAGEDDEGQNGAQSNVGRPQKIASSAAIRRLNDLHWSATNCSRSLRGHQEPLEISEIPNQSVLFSGTNGAPWRKWPLNENIMRSPPFPLKEAGGISVAAFLPRPRKLRQLRNKGCSCVELAQRFIRSR